MTFTLNRFLLALLVATVLSLTVAQVATAQSGWSLAASATHVQNGQSVTLFANGTPPDHCSYSGFSYLGQSVTPPSNTTTTYTMNCLSQGQSSVSVQASASGPPLPPTASISANPTSITQGASTVITWTSTNATSCTVRVVSGSNIATGVSGSKTVSPSSTVQYQVTCTNAQGSDSDIVVVGVNPPAFNATCSPSPTTANIGQSVRWRATVTGGISPFSYLWVGERLTGRTGVYTDITYPTHGEKFATVKVTDSSSAGGISVSHSGNRRCTGSLVSTYWDDIHDESLGFTDSEAIAIVKQYAENYFTSGGSTGRCVQQHVYQECNPNANQPELTCPYRLRVTVHSGTGTRATTASDYPTTGGWQRDRYWGTALGSTYSSGAQTITRACQVPVTVNANAPTASLTASPVSITQGSSSTLTHGCTNATSASINNGVGTVNASSGTKSVSPSSTTTYTLTCTGPGGTATKSATVTVTVPPPPTLAVSCSVSPSSITVGDSATWTANPTGGTGTYAYSWSGHSGITGSSRTVTWTYGTTGSKEASVTVTSGAQSVTRSCGAVTVSPAPAVLADLRIQATNHDTSGLAGQSLQLEALTRNYGEGTATGFYILYQRATSDGGADVTNLGTAYKSGLAPATNSWSSIYHAFPSAGTWYVRACADRSNVSAQDNLVAETNEGNNCSAWEPVTITAPLLPDLRIQATSRDTSGYTGQSLSIDALTRNYGQAATSGGFYILFQRATSAAGANATNIGTMVRGSSLGVGSNTWAKYNYAFPSSGTWYVRACTDHSHIASQNNIVPESNEGNNCSAWESITVVDPPRPDLTPWSDVYLPNTDTLVAGESVRVYTTFRNRGDETAYAPFTTRWQRATSADGANATDIGNNRNTTKNVAPATYINSLDAGIYYAFPAGTSYIRSCIDSLNEVTESNENNNCTDWEPFTAIAPDLRMWSGPYHPYTETPRAGEALYLYSVTRNYGNATAYAPFSTLYQRATNSSGANAIDIGAKRNTDNNVQPDTNLSGIDTRISYTFPSAGTWYLRSCADKQSAEHGGEVTESNENNNCSDWVRIDVAEPPEPTGSLSCEVSNTNPAQGETVTYTVTPANGASGPYVWNDTQGGSYGSGSTADRLISGAGPYVMTVDGDNVAAPASCPVVAGICANPSASISASPSRVREGQSTTITWSAQGVDESCTVTGPGINEVVTGNSCTIPNGFDTPTITAQSVYRISCDGGESTDEVIVNLIPEFEEF